MESTSCSHKHVEAFELGVCCLSCGEVRDSFQQDASSLNSSEPITRSVEDYQYNTLNRYLSEIRLVVLLPGIESDQISCRIITIELCSPPYYNPSPHYTAVSYTWATEDGDASKSRNICVYVGDDFKEKKTISVTVNCESALRQLRHVHEDRLVWIDSICINQDSIGERNNQVRMMDRIYKEASRVEICISAPGQDYRDLTNLLTNESGMWSSLESYEQHEFERHPCIVQLMSLFGMRYFGRVWVIQEILLAKVKFLHINTEVIPFTLSVLKRLNTMCSEQRVYFPRLSQWASMWNQRSDIIACLRLSLTCSASDQRDQLFAITGLLEPRIRAMISIDYMSSVEDVFSQAVSVCLAEYGISSILRYAELPMDADLAATSTFSMENFKHFLEGEKDMYSVRSVKQVWSSFSNRKFGQSKGSIPRHQLLPRLKVLAEPLEICTESTSDGAHDFLVRLEDNAYSKYESRLKQILDFSRKRFTGRFDGFCSQVLYFLLHNIRRTNGQYLANNQTVFRTLHSIRYTVGYCLPGDVIFKMAGENSTFLLRQVGSDEYRIVGECYLLATQNYSIRPEGHSVFDYSNQYENENENSKDEDARKEGEDACDEDKEAFHILKNCHKEERRFGRKLHPAYRYIEIY